jgi:hypothetical protein
MTTQTPKTTKAKNLTERMSNAEARLDFAKKQDELIIDTLQYHHVEISEIQDTFRHYRFALGIAAVVFILEAAVAISIYSHR